MPRRSASARSGRCGKYGLTLIAVALFYGSISRSRAAASPAPAKFGMRPCGGNGKRATPSAASRSQTHWAQRSWRGAPGHEGKWRARPSDNQGRDLTHEKTRRDPGSPSLTKLKSCRPAPRAFAGFFERTVAGQIKKQEPG